MGWLGARGLWGVRVNILCSIIMRTSHRESILINLNSYWMNFFIEVFLYIMFGKCIQV